MVRVNNKWEVDMFVGKLHHLCFLFHHEIFEKFFGDPMSPNEPQESMRSFSMYLSSSSLFDAEGHEVKFSVMAEVFERSKAGGTCHYPDSCIRCNPYMDKHPDSGGFNVMYVGQYEMVVSDSATIGGVFE